MKEKRSGGAHARHEPQTEPHSVGLADSPGAAEPSRQPPAHRVPLRTCPGRVLAVSLFSRNQNVQMLVGKAGASSCPGYQDQNFPHRAATPTHVPSPVQLDHAALVVLCVGPSPAAYAAYDRIYVYSYVCTRLSLSLGRLTVTFKFSYLRPGSSSLTDTPFPTCSCFEQKNGTTFSYSTFDG